MFRLPCCLAGLIAAQPVGMAPLTVAIAGGHWALFSSFTHFDKIG